MWHPYKTDEITSKPLHDENKKRMAGRRGHDKKEKRRKRREKHQTYQHQRN